MEYHKTERFINISAFDVEPYEERNKFSFISSLAAHCVVSLVPEGIPLP